MFCMLLRKHLQGARILELNQPPLERILEFRLETLDELGDRVERRLVLEAMGRGQPPAAGREGASSTASAGWTVTWPGSAAASARPVLSPAAGADKLNPFTIEPEELRLVLEKPPRQGVGQAVAGQLHRPVASGGAGAGLPAPAATRSGWAAGWRNSKTM